MSRSICSSLLLCKQFNSVDMATRFADEYKQEPGRGYGGNIISIFKEWDKLIKSKNGLTEENVLKPSELQFDGSGSYGNGAAMRVAPVSLFANSQKECIQLAKDTAYLTHSNKQGYNGAILQALAVHKALNLESSILDPFKFIDELISEMKLVERFTKDSPQKGMSDFKTDDPLHSWTRSKDFLFTQQLYTIKNLLHIRKESNGKNDVKFVIEQLGRDVSAQQAVPAAIYSFLSTLNFEDAVLFSISIGGDTDTIAAMCGAIAGSFYGICDVPSSWIECCEYRKEMTAFANRFFDRYAERV